MARFRGKSKTVPFRFTAVRDGSFSVRIYAGFTWIMMCLTFG